MNEVVSEEYMQAVQLNRSIIANAQAAQMSLYEMCKGLKEMRDGKLYKELGYQNFEMYCEQEVGIKRRAAYKYISIIDNISDNFVHAHAQNIGTEKLYLLSTLSEDDRQEITERVDVEDVTTRQLKAEIDKLKMENKQLGDANAQLTKDWQEMSSTCEAAEERAKQLAEQVQELQERPIEVVASPVNDEVEKMRQAMLQNSREWGEKYDKLQEENEKSERSLHQKYQTALSEQKADYEKQLAEAKAQEQSGASDENAVFKAYFTMAYQAFQSLVQFVQQAEGKAMMQEKIRKLTETVVQSMEG
ncbi:MAG: hypothetical protein ACI4JQ_02060 [Ruminococcus sp.]